MKFSSIIYAAFGLSSIVAALPAPAPVAGADMQTFEKRELVEAPALAPIAERAAVDIVVDVQVAIDACVAINDKYKGKGYSKSTCKAWSLEIVAVVKVLIGKIKAYPSTYKPSVDICVSIFIKLFLCIFVQLKAFINLGGLLGGLLITVDLLLSILLGVVADLLNIFVSLCLVIEAKISVGIVAKILSGCTSVLGSLWISVLVKLCVNAGIVI